MTSNSGPTSPKRYAAVSCFFVFCICLAFVCQLAGQTFSTITTFDSTNGAGPFYLSLVQGTDGALYGTTANGGSFNRGTVFKVTAAGKLTTLYSFCAQTNCPDGWCPAGALVQGLDGNFYGTNIYAGAHSAGTVFKITPAGKLTTLYSFCSEANCADGNQPISGLTLGNDGAFYGTTYFAGSSDNGTVYRITSSGVFTTIHQFAGFPSEGSSPIGNLIQARDGNFYGTTYAGGAHGGGTVFRVTPTGKMATLYSFCVQTNCTDGENLWSSLVQGNDGQLYGTTTYGGANNAGTIFKVGLSGTMTKLYDFDLLDGAYPMGALVLATNADFYGSTTGGGSNSVGTLFRLSRNGSVQTVHSFTGIDGSSPYGMIQATNGALYGTTNSGGKSDDGTIFRLSAGLGPFVETRPPLGKIGASVTILGNNLTGTSQVSFNGTPAQFTVVSNTDIRATVPSGATTGKITVVTPNGDRSSNIVFQVQP